MSGFFERRRLAKEEARQRAIANDLAANDLIALRGPVKPRPLPDEATQRPTPSAPAGPPAAAPVPPPAAADPVTQADSPSPWAAPVEHAPEHQPSESPSPSSESPAPVMSAPPAPPSSADRTATATDPDGVCRQLLELPGASAAAVVDGNGMSLAAHGDAGFDLDAGAAAAGEVLLAHRDLLGEDTITEATITTGRRHLLLHAAGPQADGLLVYLVLDAGRGNLAGARRRLSQLAAALSA